MLQAVRFLAPVAQLVEHVLGKDEASGSKPLGGFLNKPKIFCDSVVIWRGSARTGNKYARDNSFSMHGVQSYQLQQYQR